MIVLHCNSARNLLSFEKEKNMAAILIRVQNYVLNFFWVALGILFVLAFSHDFVSFVQSVCAVIASWAVLFISPLLNSRKK